jgi:hypothetical protein
MARRLLLPLTGTFIKDRELQSMTRNSMMAEVPYPETKEFKQFKVVRVVVKLVWLIPSLILCKLFIVLIII